MPHFFKKHWTRKGGNTWFVSSGLSSQIKNVSWGLKIIAASPIWMDQVKHNAWDMDTLTPNPSLIQVSINLFQVWEAKIHARMFYNLEVWFVLARISWALVHWLLSLPVFSELCCLAREVFKLVFKILIILCHPKRKDVISSVNCYPSVKWRLSAPLVLRKEHVLP